MTEWFERWFGEEYLQLYPHRDDADAERAVSLVDRVAKLDGARVLDLACGPGRHAVRLAQRGADVLGLDLSLPLLTRARHGDPPVDKLVRGDMRFLPVRDETFDLVVNLFTSFGYFAEDAEHLQVIRSIAAVLRPGGRLFMDYLNAEAVRSTLVPREEQVVGARRVAIKRSLIDDGKYVVKEMHILDEDETFLERVRLFSADDLTAMMETAGLHVVERFGSYAGDELTGETPRTILVAQRS
ncbi:MAG: methyltransferase domain-containing protein [Gemmatimonadetes bacterium]|nr:methyltransferase domain-containing protein [Gemmatimonadota bacterium]